jgi:hypothetical protein
MEYYIQRVVQVCSLGFRARSLIRQFSENGFQGILSVFIGSQRKDIKYSVSLASETLLLWGLLPGSRRFRAALN